MRVGSGRLRQLYKPVALAVLGGAMLILGLVVESRTIAELSVLVSAAAFVFLAFVESQRASSQTRKLERRVRSDKWEFADMRQALAENSGELQELRRALYATQALAEGTDLRLEAIAGERVSVTPIELLSLAEHCEGLGALALPWTLRRRLVVSLSGWDPTRAHSLVSSGDELEDLPVNVQLDLARAMSARGYLSAAETYCIAANSSVPSREGRHELQRIRATGRFLRGEVGLAYRLEPSKLSLNPRRVLHVVGASVRYAQTGYTIRTHEIAKAQSEVLDVHVVAQLGYGTAEHEEAVPEEIDGVTYHRLPGARRASVPPDEWQGMYIHALAHLVRTLRPSVLHAASDFVNAVAALHVGRAYGIPVIYETRGFWEETWLSRQASKYDWPDPETLASTQGLPEAYLWRRATEENVREAADAIVTLSEGMAERIALAGIPRSRIHLVPNAVDATLFVPAERDRALAAQFGIDSGALVIGYISSLVEYEGLDILIRAFKSARPEVRRPVFLMIVGDGPARASLERVARELEVEGVIFTGAVPHAEVSKYYSLIDIFVVPRKPVEVCHLVTPLKPFEAFAAGKAVILSDVRALEAIAAESMAALTFKAGDAAALAGQLISLIEDDGKRIDLGRRGRDWVVRNRRWAQVVHQSLELYSSLGAQPFPPHTAMSH